MGSFVGRAGETDWFEVVERRKEGDLGVPFLYLHRGPRDAPEEQSWPPVYVTLLFGMCKDYEAYDSNIPPTR